MRWHETQEISLSVRTVQLRLQPSLIEEENFRGEEWTTNLNSKHFVTHAPTHCNKAPCLTLISELNSPVIIGGLRKTTEALRFSPYSCCRF